MNDLDKDEHEALCSKPEQVTVYLVLYFLQYAQNICLLQHPESLAAEAEVRPRVERRTTHAYVAGDVLLTAENDGGICRMRRVGFGWETSNPYLAVFEAKRAFKIHCDEKIGSYIPAVLNENLAQYLGEAEITWKGNQNFPRDE